MKTFEDILKSDNDETLGRGSRVKKKKVYDSELEQPLKKKEKKATKVADLAEVPSTVIEKACEGQSILPDSAADISQNSYISVDVARAVLPLLEEKLEWQRRWQ